jgi:hypothetical protein
VAAIAVHIERSVPITTGHLGAMRRHGLVKWLGYATYAPGSYEGPPPRLRTRRPATPRRLRQELASLLGQRSSVLGLHCKTGASLESVRAALRVMCLSGLVAGNDTTGYVRVTPRRKRQA